MGYAHSEILSICMMHIGQMLIGYAKLGIGRTVREWGALDSVVELIEREAINKRLHRRFTCMAAPHAVTVFLAQRIEVIAQPFKVSDISCSPYSARMIDVR